MALVQLGKLVSVDRGGDDPGVHGGDHLQQAGAAQEACVDADVQQERRRLPARRHKLFAVQVRQLYQPVPGPICLETKKPNLDW